MASLKSQGRIDHSYRTCPDRGTNDIWTGFGKWLSLREILLRSIMGRCPIEILNDQKKAITTIQSWTIDVQLTATVRNYIEILPVFLISYVIDISFYCFQ